VVGTRTFFVFISDQLTWGNSRARRGSSCSIFIDQLSVVMWPGCRSSVAELVLNSIDATCNLRFEKRVNLGCLNICSIAGLRFVHATGFENLWCWPPWVSYHSIILQTVSVVEIRYLWLFGMQTLFFNVR